MSRLVSEKWPWIAGAHGMRSQLLDLLSDDDLGFSPGGQNMTLGALCREMGEVEQTYLQSLRTLRHEWSYGNSDPAVASSVSALRAWFETMDREMEAAVVALSGEEMIERGEPVPVAFQLDVYVQAVLIFLGKATIFLRAMDRPLPQVFRDFIG